MPLADASSRGARLNARFAVNGIQSCSSESSDPRTPDSVAVSVIDIVAPRVSARLRVPVARSFGAVAGTQSRITFGLTFVGQLLIPLRGGNRVALRLVAFPPFARDLACELAITEPE